MEESSIISSTKYYIFQKTKNQKEKMEDSSLLF